VSADAHTRVVTVAPSQLQDEKYVLMRQVVGDSVYTTSTSAPLAASGVCVPVSRPPIQNTICTDEVVQNAQALVVQNPYVNTAVPSVCEECTLVSPDYTGQGPVSSGFGEAADATANTNTGLVTFGDDGDTTAVVGGHAVKTGAGKYSCHKVSIVRTKETFGVYRWGIKLVKNWCGYSRGRITSQDKTTYISTGTNVSQRQPYYSNTQTINRSHGNSYSHGYFHDSYGPFSKDDDPLVGLNFYANGDFDPYQSG
jgi:hypothetical protein